MCQMAEMDAILKQIAETIALADTRKAEKQDMSAIMKDLEGGASLPDIYRKYPATMLKFQRPIILYYDVLAHQRALACPDS